MHLRLILLLMAALSLLRTLNVLVKQRMVARSLLT